MSPASDTIAGQKRLLVHLGPWLLAVITLLAYANSLHGPFLFDDFGQIVNNPAIQTLGPWSKYFSGYDYRPLVTLSLAINYQLHGLHVAGYHLFNLAVHLAAGLMLYALLLRLLMRPSFGPWCRTHAPAVAWVIAALWLVHPLNTQAVDYIIQRAELMMGLCMIAMMYSLVRLAEAQEKPSRHAWVWGVAAVGLCWAGMLCKQVMVTAPIIALLLDRTLLADGFKSTLKKRGLVHAGLFASWTLTLLIAGGKTLVQQNVTAGFGQAQLPWLDYALSQSAVLLHYIRLVVWPAGLCFDYLWRPAQHISDYLGQTVVIFTLLLMMFYALWRRHWSGVAAAWFFFTLAPTSSIMPLQDLAVEHRMYLPGIAVLAVLVYLALRILRRVNAPLRGPITIALAAAALLSLMTATHLRNRDYQSNVSLWAATVDHPIGQHNHRAWYQLAKALLDAGDLDAARQAAQRSLALWDGRAANHVILGRIARLQNDLPAAQQQFEKAVTLDPDDPVAQTNLGTVLAMQKHYDEAKNHLMRALEIDPNQIEAHRSLAAMAFAQHDATGYETHLKKILELQPDDLPALIAWGTWLARTGRADDAMRVFTHALNVARDQGRAEAVKQIQSALARLDAAKRGG